MAELSHGVVVCDGGGRVLLYNHEASRIFAGGDAGASPAARPASQPLGLGRSIFSLLDRGALTGALHRIELGRSDRHHSRFTAAGPGGQLLRATIGLLGPEAGSTGAGFVMVLDDATGDLVTRDQQSELLLELLEGSRGRLAAISGAVAMLDGYPDLEPAGVARFQAIIAEESARLSTDMADVQQRAQALRATGWEQSDMLCRDLLLAAARQLATGGGLEIAIGDDAGLWARVDAGGVFAALRAVAGDLVASGEVKEIELSCDDNDPFVALRLAWSPGATATSGSAARLAGAQVATGDVAALARRHGTEAWLDRSPAGADQLTVLLPKAAASPPSQGRAPLGGRPTTYDFDLLVAPRAGGDLAACPLGELAYTVFDLETTGLDPAGGDRIVSIGAVRIVNTRLLRHETFDRIVDPERPIPPESAAVHGITSETVRGAATIVEILPDFALFAGETVLVGHNVAFDLRFLQQALPGARGLLDLPVLDTLLLAELAFGEAERHTLEWLGDTLGIDVTGRHTALGDALVTADVFLGLVPLLAAKGWRTLGDVATAAATTSYARLDY
jgi:DNA polymerase-3 subunit epsilon